MSNKFIVVDVETTGFTSEDRVIQLAYFVYEEGQIQLSKNFFFTVDRMNPDAEAVHGFSIENLKELSGGKIFADVADEIAKDFSGGVFVAHNAEFDFRFISQEFRQTNISMPSMPRYCTMKVLTPIMRLPKNKYPKLSEAVSHYNIPEKAIQILLSKFFGEDGKVAHDARYDITCVALLLYQAKLEESITMLCTLVGNE